ncbi:MAG: putative solute-binding protein, partial [Pseudomonadota bacterium]|nr:putative solute-binding protein [Pseudomonadota bacterium]
MKNPLLLPAFCLLMLLTALPGIAETTTKVRSHQTLEAAVLNPNLPLEKRIRALKTLLSDEMTDGRLHRTFCIWDPISKAGPIASTAKDQVLRSLHYGMQLTIEVFQNEQEMVDTFVNKKTCDAILVRGATAQRFNRFLATTEAPGALPDRQHLQLLAQVLAKPEIADHMTNGQYTALG